MMSGDESALFLVGMLVGLATCVFGRLYVMSWIVERIKTRVGVYKLVVAILIENAIFWVTLFYFLFYFPAFAIGAGLVGSVDLGLQAYHAYRADRKDQEGDRLNV